MMSSICYPQEFTNGLLRRILKAGLQESLSWNALVGGLEGLVGLSVTLLVTNLTGRENLTPRGNDIELCKT